ncbi:MAG: hypothetical protein JF615_02330 [Asticcacaulis sp.]|nr:hypothetical protein [Asticcacaulis sp.]
MTMLKKLAPWLAFGLLCLVVAIPWHKPRPQLQPTGYVNIVNQLIRNGRLAARGYGENLRVANICDPCRAESVGLLDRWLALDFGFSRDFDFTDQSYLAEDLNNPSVWRPDRGGGLDAYLVQARQLTGPVVTSHDWPWNIRYDASDGAPDTSRASVIFLATRSQAALAPGGRVILPATGGAVTLDDDRSVTFSTCGNLDIVEVDGGRTYTVRCGQPIRRGSYEGRTYVVSRHDNGGGYLSRRTPDLITLVDSGAYISQTAGSARVRDPLLAGEAPDNLVTALEGGYYRGRSCGDATSRDLCTTLRRDLQQSSQIALQRTANGLRDTSPSSFRAGAVFMDGRSGAIAAVPTYPLTHADLKPAEANYPWLQPWLSENTNFARLSVGSTAKIPFAVAILQQWPALRGLKVENNGGDRVDRILGVGHPITDDEAELAFNPMDFSHFISKSSNKYARTLMVLGLNEDRTDYAHALISGRKPGRTASGDRDWDGYWLGGRYSLVAPKWPRSDAGLASAWRDNLWKYFCVEPNRLDSRAANTTTACRNPDDLASSWFPAGDFERFAALAPLYFTPPELGYDDLGPGDIDSYLMTVLGGADSRWSTLHLAQTYARIFSDCPVEARFVRTARTAEPCAGDLGLNPDNLAAVRRGMADTVPAGTAVSIAPAVNAFLAEAGDGYRVYAKTGTPNLSVQSYFAGLRAALQDDRCVVVKVGQRIRLSNAQTCPKAIRRAAQADISRFNGIRGLSQYAETAPGDDRVVSLTREAHYTLPSSGSGKALVLVVEHTDNGQACTLSTIAINFQFWQLHTPSPALAYAGQLLADPAVKRWLTRPCNR